MIDAIKGWAAGAAAWWNRWRLGVQVFAVGSLLVILLLAALRIKSCLFDPPKPVDCSRPGKCAQDLQRFDEAQK